MHRYHIYWQFPNHITCQCRNLKVSLALFSLCVIVQSDDSQICNKHVITYLTSLLSVTQLQRGCHRGDNIDTVYHCYNFVYDNRTCLTALFVVDVTELTLNNLNKPNGLNHMRSDCQLIDGILLKTHNGYGLWCQLWRRDCFVWWNGLDRVIKRVHCVKT